MKHHLMRLDRIAGEMNAWLLVIAIGLGMLDLAVLVAKCIPAVAVPPPYYQCIRSPTRSSIAVPSR